MKCQKNKFSLPEDVVYLNGAYKSPQLKSAEAVGVSMLRKQNHPNLITPDDFFVAADRLKKAFAKLINTPNFDRVALIPSVSYGIANVTNNIKLKSNEKIIILEDQFPSNVYPWYRLAEKYGAQIETIKAPNDGYLRGKIWNERILDAIDDSTAVIALGHVHWTDGTKFNLKAIREKTLKHDTLMIIDGTQSVGAMPFNVSELQPDALICTGYKWLMGPYSLALAYYGPVFDQGQPIEEHWLPRLNSEDFSKLVDYQFDYRPYANKYAMGEQSNFILAPIFYTGIEQLNDWGIENIQNYCQSISEEAIETLNDMGAQIELPEYRCKHILGLRLNDSFNLDLLKSTLSKENVIISYRGDSIRIAPNVYNDVSDFDKLLSCFEIARINSGVWNAI